MIPESITIHSHKINHSATKFTLDYPMGSYIPSWKIFRAFTNENQLISKHILSTKSWKKTKPSRILDIGTGDGLVLKAIIAGSLHPFSKVRVVEPNPILFRQAQQNLSSSKLYFTFEGLEDDVMEVTEKVFQDIDLVLITHVLYLLQKNEMKKLLSLLPNDVPVVIVTDTKKSLFPDCWSETALKFFQRSQFIHKVINQLQQNGNYDIKTSTFRTFLQNPFLIDRDDLKERILSMVCYSEFNELKPSVQKNIKKIMSRYSVEELVYCNSTCYEITKKS